MSMMVAFFAALSGFSAACSFETPETPSVPADVDSGINDSSNPDAVSDAGIGDDASVAHDASGADGAEDAGVEDDANEQDADGSDAEETAIDGGAKSDAEIAEDATPGVDGDFAPDAEPVDAGTALDAEPLDAEPLTQPLGCGRPSDATAPDVGLSPDASPIRTPS